MSKGLRPAPKKIPEFKHPPWIDAMNGRERKEKLTTQ